MAEFCERPRKIIALTFESAIYISKGYRLPINREKNLPNRPKTKNGVFVEIELEGVRRVNWRELIDGKHGLYLACGCSWKADVDPRTIKATDTWPVPKVVAALPCRSCGETGLEMVITSPWA